jgi:nucleoside phosphorylase
MADTADIVLFTVNKHETEQTNMAFGKSGPATSYGAYSYWRYGAVGGAQVVHAECSMADLPAGKTARSAMSVWQPRLLIAIGIAWGANDNEQTIGDILLADPLRDSANHADRDGKIEPRGQPFALPDNLRQIVKVSHRDWRAADVERRAKLHIGELISMPKLLDNSTERARWIEAFPNATGGEMEGRGMVDAAVEHKCDWLVLKAICDWGKDKNVNEPQKEGDQALAAKNAAQFLRFAVEHGLGPWAASQRTSAPPRTSGVTQQITINTGAVSGTIIGSANVVNINQALPNGSTLDDGTF